MGRPLRIEYEGATYHVMCRGTRGAKVFGSAEEAEWWLDTLGEAVERCGWRVHAWTLMRTHYHLLLETPEANLVRGMKWFQGTFTQRLNARQRTWGHVYQGRYKAKLIDPDEPEYFAAVATYIHLNPAAAGLIEGKARLADYRWSSFPDYLQAPSQRRGWLHTGRVLGSAGISADTARGRRAYGEYLEKRRTEAQGQWGRKNGRSEWAKLERGWVHGSPAFRDYLLEQLEEGGRVAGRRVEDGEQVRDHGERGALAALDACLPVLGLTLSELRALRKGDERKALVAGLIKARHAVSNRWLSAQLNMGDQATVSRSTRLYRDPPARLRPLLRKLRKCQRS